MEHNGISLADGVIRRQVEVESLDKVLTVLSVLTSENSFPQAKLVDRREYGLKSTAPSPCE